MHWILTLTLASGLSLPLETTEEACRTTEQVITLGGPIIVYLTPEHSVEAVSAVCTQEAGA